MNGEKMDAPLTKEEFVEANRIARELVSLHKAGFLNGADDKRAEIAAGALQLFGGRFEDESRSKGTCTNRTHS